MITKGGLLVAGLVVPVDGFEIANPLDTTWSKLGPGDYWMRRSAWAPIAIVHTTKGKHPQRILPGGLPGGKDRLVAEFYRGDPEHNGCATVADVDGTGACLCDIATQAAHHARLSNQRSWGVEIYQLANGDVTERSIAVAIAIIAAGTEALGNPLQMHFAPYTGKPIARLAREDGGADCVGIFGHRDQTRARGRGDPGDSVTAAFAASGRFECFDYNQGEDLRAWERRQRKMRAMGEAVDVDGVCGPVTHAAMLRLGFKSGRELDAAVERPLPTAHE